MKLSREISAPARTGRGTAPCFLAHGLLLDVFDELLDSGPPLGTGAVRAPALGAEVIESGHRAIWSDFEDCATAIIRAGAVSAKACGPVEVPIGGQDEPCVGLFAVPASTLGTEIVDRFEGARWRDFKDRAAAVGLAKRGCPVDVPIGGLDQRTLGRAAVRAAARGAGKRVKRGRVCAGTSAGYRE